MSYVYIIQGRVDELYDGEQATLNGVLEPNTKLLHRYPFSFSYLSRRMKTGLNDSLRTRMP